VAAAAEEVTRKPLSRWLLEQPVVLFRTEEGSVAALEDRCAHRWAPLSQGQLIGDEIACPYHGFRYNTRGACTFIPSQPHARVPAALKVLSYPVREHANFVWIWMGDPARADPSLLPHIPWLDDGTCHFQWRSRHMEFGCNYMAVQENLMDFTHIAHLHADNAYAGVERAPDFEVTDRSVSFVRTDSDVPAEPFIADMLDIEAGRKVKRIERGTFVSPTCFVLRNDIEVGSPTNAETTCYTAHVVHCMTPISPTRCHYWQAFTRNYGPRADNDLDENMDADAAVVINQDKQMLEAIQTTIERDMRGNTVREISVPADRGAIEARRILKRMLEEEAR